MNFVDRPYIPQVGDSVCARRKVKSSIYANTIVGPVIETWPNACRIVTNKGTDIEGDFQLFFTDWKFQFLHKTNSVIDMTPASGTKPTLDNSEREKR